MSSRLQAGAHDFVKHVQKRQEWPPGTSLAEYIASIREVILDESSGIMLGSYLGLAWQLTFVRRSGPLHGPGGFAWVMVDYRVDTGHWVTAFQFDGTPETVLFPSRRDVRWLRPPQ